MKKYFDIIEAAKKWCIENGHDGFYCTTSGVACGCFVDDLCPCGCEESLYNGYCAGGKKYVGNFIDMDGNECKFAIAPHDWKRESEQ
jgi:hypothetical protein